MSGAGPADGVAGAPARAAEPAPRARRAGRLASVRVIAAFALRESLRRRVFVVVAILTVAFLALYGLGSWKAFQEVQGLGPATAGVDAEIVAGATLLGLAMFGTLFLGTILAVFLTLGAVQGDAERGLLQPLLVRPVPRPTFLLARYLAAASVCAAYVVVVFVAAAVITRIAGGWWPDRIVVPALGLALGVAILAALSLAGSVVLASTANGIAIFMLFGAGLVGGLLGQIGEAIGSGTLDDVATVTSWALPFEALYQSGLADLTADTVGFTRLAIDLGPFGGAEPAGLGLWAWALAYLALTGVAAALAFRRRDL
jgi:ABC-type transport system involved in multi-copper enzyme maturation permease subunit